METNKIRIVFLTGPGQLSRIMYNALLPEVEIVRVVLEKKISSSILIKGRLKRLGLPTVGGQLLFIAFNKLILSRTSKSQISRLLDKYELNDNQYPPEIVRNVESINHQEVINILQELEPDAVVVNGTRIISQKVLSSIDVPFVNTHMGITPKYRGVHGGYWALTQHDKENCGVTIHLVDKGIDTGGVLYQDTINAENTDNFSTYPFHQIAKAIPLMKIALRDISQKNIKIKPGINPSKLWYHPTLYEYLSYRFIDGVK